MICVLISSNCLPFFSYSILDTFCLWRLIFCHVFFILFLEFSQENWSDLTFPLLVGDVLSELSTMIHLSWVVLHVMTHSSIELCKSLFYNKAVIHEGGDLYIITYYNNSHLLITKVSFLVFVYATQTILSSVNVNSFIFFLVTLYIFISCLFHYIS